MLTTILVLLALTLLFFLYMRQPQFGKAPSGERLERIKRSPQYRDGIFHNQSITPDLTEGVGYWAVMREFLFGGSKRKAPTDVLPSQKTDLKHLRPDEDVLVWFGHSSYFIQIDGKRILVDPVFSGGASPLPVGTKSFPGSDVYTVDDLPEIDFLFLSHDHYDHLDHQTVSKLRSKVRKVICPLGVGAHLEHWGYAPNRIIEKDWNEEIHLGDGFSAHTVPARHFSGRSFSRKNTLWTSYVLRTPTMRIFLGGDSGYDMHFAEIGEQHGPFDFAILECGQYDKSWKYIHLLPEEILPACKELRAERLLPVHWGKFVMANHAWDEPIRLLSEYNKPLGIPLLTPMIGERINLKDKTQRFTAWWEGVK